MKKRRVNGMLMSYLTEQITRYPEPIIHNYDKTYFRICKAVFTLKISCAIPDSECFN